MLRRGEIFFASVAELNDASECRPRLVLNGSQELWQRLAGFILQMVCVRSDFCDQTPDDEIRRLFTLCGPLGTLLKQHARNRDCGLEELDQLFRTQLTQVLNTHSASAHLQFLVPACKAFITSELPSLIDEQSYIASFSRNAKNPTMWGHYADAERGFVIVYTTSDARLSVQSPINILYGTRPLRDDDIAHYEIGIYPEDQLQLKKVTYSRKPPKVNAFHALIPQFLYSEEEDHYDVPLLLGGDAPEKNSDQLGLVKFSDWRYEQEIRAFLPTFGRVTLPPDARVLQVSRTNIRGLIFGPRMSAQHKARAVLCCHLMRESSVECAEEPKAEFAFFQAKELVDRFDFKISAVGLLDGRYHGKQLPFKPLDQTGDATRKSLERLAAHIDSGLQDFP